MKVNGREAGFQAYLLVACGVRLEVPNSNLHIGSSTGRSHRVSPRRSIGSSPERSFECSSQISFDVSFQESSAASDVRSDGLSSGRSRVLSGVARSGRRSAISPRTSSMTYFDGSFLASFLMSLAGRSWRPRYQFAVNNQAPSANDYSNPNDRMPVFFVPWW